MPHSLHSRRRFIRLAAAGAGGLLIPAMWNQGSVDAARVWCRVDPDVLLERTFVRVEVAVPEEHLPLVNGPTWLRFNIPAGVDRELVWVDAGFNGLGYDVTFARPFQPGIAMTTFNVNLTIRVPIADRTKVPIWCCAAPDLGDYVEGTGNDAQTGITLNFMMHGTP